MIFTKSKKEPKKTPEEEYTDQISTLSEKELRDLHKDLKIDHYGNSTAAVINTASGVGLLSLRSTIRRDKTERMQIEIMEARMKEMGWTPHPNRYRDAVPIALGVAAGTTSGMTFGLVNVEKSAKRTKAYVKKKDLFKTKEEEEVVETIQEVNAETSEEEVEGVDFEGGDNKVEGTEASSMDPAQTLETSTEPPISEHTIARKPVPISNPASVPAPAPAPAAAVVTDIKAESSQPESLDAATSLAPTASTTSTPPPSTDPISTDPPTTMTTISPTVTTEPNPEPEPEPEPSTTTKEKEKEKESLFFSPMNFKKMRGFHFNSNKKDKGEEKETITKATTISVTEIACDAA